MNERIEELVKQATFDIKDVYGHWINSELDKEKFAELIIQECLNICEDMGDNGKDGHYCADKITKTFLR